MAHDFTKASGHVCQCKNGCASGGPCCGSGKCGGHKAEEKDGEALAAQATLQPLLKPQNPNVDLRTFNPKSVLGG